MGIHGGSPAPGYFLSPIADVVFPDNINLIYGTGSDTKTYYDATDFIINPKAVGSGRAVILWAAVGATPTGTGLQLRNATAAAAGAQQYSPMHEQIGYGWKTTATAASQSVAFGSWVRPIEGTSAPTGGWDLGVSINAAAYTTLLTLLSNGRVGIGTSAPGVSLDVSFAADAWIRVISTGADSSAYLTVQNDARQWNWKVDGSMTGDPLLLRDGTATATRMIINSAGLVTFGPTLYANQPANSVGVPGGLMVGADTLNALIDDAAGGAGSTPLYVGNAVILVGNGVNFGPGAVASITVVNGQITAIS